MVVRWRRGDGEVLPGPASWHLGTSQTGSAPPATASASAGPVAACCGPSFSADTPPASREPQEMTQTSQCGSGGIISGVRTPFLLGPPIRDERDDNVRSSFTGKIHFGRRKVVVLHLAALQAVYFGSWPSSGSWRPWAERHRLNKIAPRGTSAALVFFTLFNPPLTLEVGEVVPVKPTRLLEGFYIFQNVLFLRLKQLVNIEIQS